MSTSWLQERARLAAAAIERPPQLDIGWQQERYQQRQQFIREVIEQVAQEFAEKAIVEAVAAEREECAVRAERFAEKSRDPDVCSLARSIAQSIRARGKGKP